MSARDSEHLLQFRKSLQDWRDERFLTKQTLDDLAMYNLYLVNLADEDGWAYDGHSLSIGSPMSRLVTRGTHEGVPHVVFTSARTTAGCMRIFLRKMTEGTLEWRKDKYRS